MMPIRGWFSFQGYIGYGWQGCGPPASSHTGVPGGGPHTNRDYWEPLFDLDVGEPLGLCTQEAGQSAAGVFKREYSKGTAALDCNTFEASLAFEMKPGGSPPTAVR